MRFQNIGKTMATKVLFTPNYSLTVFRIVAIQFLHESDTVQEIQSNKIKIEEHKNSNQKVKSELSIKQEGGEGDLLFCYNVLVVGIFDFINFQSNFRRSRV